MKVDENTKLIARFHTQANSRGLNIYNPYFEEMDVNAVYLLFQNPAVGPLFEALRTLKMAGAIPAAFERDPEITKSVDQLVGVARKIRKVSFVKYDGKKLQGFYAGGKGLAEAIGEIEPDLSGKKVVIMGAGTVVNGLLAHWELERQPVRQIEVFNRGSKRLGFLKKAFPRIKVGGGLAQLERAEGDVFVNATPVGSPWNKGEDFDFKDDFLKRFSVVADVTFVPLAPPLIQKCQRLLIPYAPGWKMFLYQGKFALETILGVSVDAGVLSKYVVDEFARSLA